MLVLSFRRWDCTFVTGPCLVTLVEDSHRPRIGFSAHADVPIIRGGVLLDLLKQELGAKRLPGEDDLTDGERSAIEVAYLVLSDEEASPDIVFQTLNNEHLMELLIGFHRDLSTQQAA